MAFEHAIALTGSIATGKSTVASLLKLQGFRIIDADAVAHEVLASQASWVASTFGEQYVSHSSVDRPKLGQLIFHNAEAKAELEGFLHPKIYDTILEQSLYQEQFQFPYLIDIPLFFENGRYAIKHSVVVYTPFDVQIKRLMARNAYGYDEAKARIENQWPIEKKRALATWVIDNSGSLKQLQDEVEQFTERVKLAHERNEV